MNILFDQGGHKRLPLNSFPCISCMPHHAPINSTMTYPRRGPPGEFELSRLYLNLNVRLGTRYVRTRCNLILSHANLELRATDRRFDLRPRATSGANSFTGLPPVIPSTCINDVLLAGEDGAGGGKLHNSCETKKFHANLGHELTLTLPSCCYPAGSSA